MAKNIIYSGLCSLVIIRPVGEDESVDDTVDMEIFIVDGQTVIHRKDTGTINILPSSTEIKIIEEEKGG